MEKKALGCFYHRAGRVHTLDQFFRVEEGYGEAVLDGVRTAIRAGGGEVARYIGRHGTIRVAKAALIAADRRTYRTTRPGGRE